MRIANKKYTGLNVQFPISQLIVSRRKTVETRTYPLPKKYLNIPLALIETPGRSARFRSRIIGLVVFSECIRYRNAKHFYSDFLKHRVSSVSPWRWTAAKPKWGWVISKVQHIDPPVIFTRKKGIIYTRNVSVDLSGRRA